MLDYAVDDDMYVILNIHHDTEKLLLHLKVILKEELLMILILIRKKNLPLSAITCSVRS